MKNCSKGGAVNIITKGKDLFYVLGADLRRVGMLDIHVSLNLTINSMGIISHFLEYLALCWRPCMSSDWHHNKSMSL